ncbi:hypothetical protein [Frankia sp. R43]|uniref:hypothetical protein n=1 Tax=Frankia sp. R43 TaxID=269536 RepID=UPI00128F6401|nr:hypothetical protein [Frankia sp. R43]
MADKVFELRCGRVPAPDLCPAVEYVEVDEGVDGTSFTVHLKISQGPDGEWSLLSEERFEPFAPLGVSVGFTGGGGPITAEGALPGGGGGLENLVAAHAVGSELRLTGGEAHVDILGQDAWAVLGAEEKIVAWPDLADSAIAVV